MDARTCSFTVEIAEPHRFCHIKQYEKIILRTFFLAVAYILTDLHLGTYNTRPAKRSCMRVVGVAPSCASAVVVLACATTAGCCAWLLCHRSSIYLHWLLLPSSSCYLCLISCSCYCFLLWCLFHYCILLCRSSWTALARLHLMNWTMQGVTCES